MSEVDPAGRKSPSTHSIRSLPSVDEVLRSVAAPLLVSFPRSMVRAAVRQVIDRQRKRILAREAPDDARSRPTESEIRAELEVLQAPVLRRVINATGVVLHTNLGRAPLAASALEHLVECARGYCNLEFDLEARRRGSRGQALEPLLEELTGAPAAVAVNNNAAAMLLALGAVAVGGEVVVSRGELVEIGGSFRVPDILEASGARLREVGTTNRTRISDYAGAVGPDTRAILKVHRSNFAVVGFTSEPEPEALAGLARERGLPSIFDLGSGALIDFAARGLPGEFSVRSAVASGFDLVAFSGDKLLGGPQAGLIVGRADLVDRLRRHPLYRALRLDRLRVAALEQTLRLYRAGEEEAVKAIPALEMLAATPASLKRTARRLRDAIVRRCEGDRLSVDLVEVRSAPGGGSFPLADLPGWAVRVRVADVSVGRLEAALRKANPPILGRVADEALLLDPRTIRPDESKLVAVAVAGLEALR